MRSQSRNLSFPQRGSVSCLATNAENAELVLRRVVKAASDELNKVTNGVYRERYGKCDKRTGDSDGGSAGNCTGASEVTVGWRCSVSEEKNAR